MKKSEIKAGVEYAYYKDSDYSSVRRGSMRATKARVSQEALDQKVGMYDNKCAVQGWVWRKGFAQNEPKEFGWFPAELNIKKFQDEWAVHEKWVHEAVVRHQNAEQAEAKRKAEWAEIEEQVCGYFGVDKWSVRRRGNTVQVDFKMSDIVAMVEARKEKRVA
jgi:hypothetical protein